MTQQIFFDLIWIDTLSESNDFLAKVMVPVLMWEKKEKLNDKINDLDK